MSNYNAPEVLYVPLEERSPLCVSEPESATNTLNNMLNNVIYFED